MEIAYFQLLIRLIKTSNAPISLFSYLTGIFCNSLNRTNMLLSIAIQSVIRRVGVSFCEKEKEEKNLVLFRRLLIILSIRPNKTTIMTTENKRHERAAHLQ